MGQLVGYTGSRQFCPNCGESFMLQRHRHHTCHEYTGIEAITVWRCRLPNGNYLRRLLHEQLLPLLLRTPAHGAFAVDDTTS